MADRYIVTTTPDLRGFGILDRELYGFCTLMDEDRNLLPLEWTMKEGAEQWLKFCFRRWQVWEGDQAKAASVPLRWRPHPPANSPWDRGWRFYN